MNQVLLIIDAQQELVDGNHERSAVFQKSQLIANINLVIEKAERAAVPVVFVRDLDVSDGKGSGFEIHKDIHVPTDAKIFDKSATNAFYETGLLEYLKLHQIKHIVVMGCETQHCIDSAVRTATINGFDVTLVGDGHSNLGNKLLNPEQIIKHHNETLHGHYNVDHFSIIRNAEEDLLHPTQDSYR
ncbi:isochorismatase family protein [Oceanobacillus jeddahense]|uniref:isochorismatase family protein n=1 Tax=Oceanobacillus jeddahense TaxID=1462527 RepID=UPI00059623D9|nr:isochorismatase family protein [Oceanobacillus jeddahense]